MQITLFYKFKSNLNRQLPLVKEKSCLENEASVSANGKVI